MENQSTPIENLIHIDDSSTESSNLSASAQVLQKYNELERLAGINLNKKISPKQAKKEALAVANKIVKKYGNKLDVPIIPKKNYKDLTEKQAIKYARVLCTAVAKL